MGNFVVDDDDDDDDETGSEFINSFFVVGKSKVHLLCLKVTGRPVTSHVSICNTLIYCTC
jgi:hypothetical protein